MKTDVTNNYFKSTIRDVGNFIKHGNEPPYDLLLNFVGELEYTNLILPANIKGEDLIFEEIFTGARLGMIPLFTDDDEFSKHGSDFDPVPFELDFYIEMIKNSQKCGGYIVNMESEKFYLPRDLLTELKFSPKAVYDGDAMEPAEALEVAKTVTNDSFTEFIKTGSPDYDELLAHLKNSLLFNVVYLQNPHDLDYVNCIDANLAVKSVGREKYGLLFTDIKNITQTTDDDCMFQIANLNEFFEFILRNDMDGIIVNPGFDDYYIQRNSILKMARTVTFTDAIYRNASYVAFKL